VTAASWARAAEGSRQPGRGLELRPFLQYLGLSGPVSPLTCGFAAHRDLLVPIALPGQRSGGSGTYRLTLCELHTLPSDERGS
jgi:hypothetical protein